ncbi:uncharacterized protein LOC6544288 isoform X2 [Drosophila erecta]|uniref:uncharacterized protein LOC6544288 isoform X2 n=1 Tax=Drosophila erecta TaxID=7220 RepID=UPI000F05BCE4|nr:uncharacterized protein LOC6544288 isoform X2 [Drosophila erecta]
MNKMSNVYKDHYHVLGLARNASDSEIREAFRRLSLQYHPDKNENGAGEFLKINDAYRVLIDHHKRASYDRRLSFRDLEAIIPSENASGQLSELRIIKTSPGNFHKKLKVAVVIGGVLVGTYVAYRVFQKSPPIIPVPQPITPPAIPTQELSELHPGYLWTLISGLVTLRSKRILSLGKLATGANIRVSPSTLKAPLSSAAEVVAKTVIQGPGGVGSTATSSSSLATPANVVAKMAKTLFKGSRSGLYTASKTVVVPSTEILHWSKTAAKCTLATLKKGTSYARSPVPSGSVLLSSIPSALRAFAGTFRPALVKSKNIVVKKASASWIQKKRL